MKQRHDVIVIGAGHNGLVAAGLLARRGLDVLLLERRECVGGAAVTESPWGPDFKVSALSYVVSLMPPQVVRELRLEAHGYRIYPQHGYFAPFRDGSYLQLPDDPAARRAQIAKLSERDAERFADWDAWIGALGQSLGPLLMAVPPALGSRRPGDLLDQLTLAWRMRDLGTRGVADLTRAMTMSVSDLLDDFFESDRLKGVLAVSGVIGTWAGPRSPGTGLVMAHHKIGDLGDGKLGAWGFHEGGMGGLTAVMRRAAEAAGAVVRTGSPVEEILVDGGAARGVRLAGGQELRADTIVTTTHPKISFLQLLDAAQLPADFVQDIERWRTRSGTVKVNLALDGLPNFRAKPGFDVQVHGGTIVLSESVEELETAFQEAASGRGAERPFADISIPSVFDPTLAPEGKHVMSMFSQWVPHEWATRPEPAALEAYADRLVARVEELAPGFEKSVLHRQVIGPHQMQEEYGLVGGNIFHGELSPSQLFHMRPAPGYADFRTPIRGLFQASSATHGGGGVTAIPALQAVRTITLGR